MMQTQKIFKLDNRQIIKVSGPDRFAFLQGLITQDINALKTKPAIYAALLTQQGRYLYDFFVIAPNNLPNAPVHTSIEDDYFLIETDHRADELLRRLMVYKLRRHVHLEIIPECNVYVCSLSVNNSKEVIAFEDPRIPDLWQRIISFSPMSDACTHLDEYHYIRIQNCLPNSETDLIVERTFALEADLAQLKAINFKKGCYIGQEPVARAYYQGVVRKKLMTVILHGSLPSHGSKILLEDGTEIGDLRSTVSYNNHQIGIAMLRTEFIKNDTILRSGDKFCSDTELAVYCPEKPLSNTLSSYSSSGAS